MAAHLTPLRTHPLPTTHHRPPTAPLPRLRHGIASMDLVEVNPALDPPQPVNQAMHGDNPSLAPGTSPTVKLAAELALSALGKVIM